MKFALLLLRALIPSTLHAAIAAGDGGSGSESRCIDLNFRAARIQSDDSCALLRTVESGGRIFADHAPDVAADVDATCGFRSEEDGIRRRGVRILVDDPSALTCVEEVADVVAEMADEGCRITGGNTVENFLRFVSDGREGLSSLTRLACRRFGGCFADVRRAVEYCLDNPLEGGDCMDYVTCECMDDLFSVIEFSSSSSSSSSSSMDFLKLDDAIARSAELAGRRCRCEDLNRRASSLESSDPACALAEKIVQEGTVLAGDADVLALTCGAGPAAATCGEKVVEIVDEFVQYDCEVYESADFMYALTSGRGDFERIAEYACENEGCYGSVRTCGVYYPNEYDSCAEAISCECKRSFLAFLEGLSPNSKGGGGGGGFVPAEVADRARSDVVDCECDDLRAEAASLRSQGRCALHDAVAREGDVFAGTAAEIRSTCSERTSCVKGVERIVGGMRDRGCRRSEERGGTGDGDGEGDVVANFLNRTGDYLDEWEEVTRFVCDIADGDREEDSSSEWRYDGCYNEIRAVVKDCDQDDVSAGNACTQSARSNCLVSFLRTVDRLSDGARDDLLGVEASTLRRIESWNVTEYATTSPTSRPTPRSRPTSGAIYRAPSTAVFVSSSMMLTSVVYAYS